MTTTRWLGSALLPALLGACATAPGAHPHDMSAAEHDRRAGAHAALAEGHSGEHDPEGAVERTRCSRGGDPERQASAPCWTSSTNPTDAHLRIAGEHRRAAADHRAASAQLRETEARACTGIDPDDRDLSPFLHVEDIARVEPLMEPSGPAGAVVTFRAIPGATAEWLQRVVDCHLARNATLGHQIAAMPDCPLVPKGARAEVKSAGDGLAVEIRADDAATARDILSRAERLQ